MINQYPAWKYAMVAVIIVIGVLYALPNLYGKKPTVILKSNLEDPMTDSFRKQATALLKSAKIAFTGSEVKGKRLYFYFKDTETQLKATTAFKEKYSENYVIAQNLVPDTPVWMQKINAKPMQLGLDLQGGLHAVMEVDLHSALKKSVDQLHKRVRQELLKKKYRNRGVRKIAHQSRKAAGDKLSGLEAADPRVRELSAHYGLKIKFKKKKNFERAKKYLSQNYGDASKDKTHWIFSSTEGDTMYLVMLMRNKTIDKEKDAALEKNIQTLRRRADESGVSEPAIRRQGKDRIVIQLPGVQDPARLKAIMGKQAILEAHGVSDNDKGVARDRKTGKVICLNPKDVVPASDEEVYFDRDGCPLLLKKEVVWSGENVKNAVGGFSSGKNPTPAVHITLDDKGGKRNSEYSSRHVGKRIAIVFIDTVEVYSKNKTDPKTGEPVKRYKTRKVVINDAVIQTRIFKNFEINNMESQETANTLALLLRSGSLAAPMYTVEERTVGPSLGKQNIEQGFNSVIIGFVLVLVFMLVYYRLFGLIANIALVLNLVLLVSVLSMLQATLTLPGVAGIVLTVGMAVDANVLIFERIREEIRMGNSPQASIHAGYEKALSTIADANITTFIAAVVLLGIGSGPVKGFAVTLSLGILTSMFTAIMVTRALVNLWYGGRRLESLSI